MSKTAGIVGAGILGRLLALVLSDQGYRVTIFDQDDAQGRKSCSFAAAGMLSPYVEFEKAEALIVKLGVQSLELWPALAGQLSEPGLFQQNGTLVIAHSRDFADLERLKRRVQSGNFGENIFREVSDKEMGNLEPDLSERFSSGLFFPFEGVVLVRALLSSLLEVLIKRGVTFHFNTPVSELSEIRDFDWVFDCRGLGAREDVSGLRGVRGELVWVQAPDVTLSRPIRLMHPRYPVYIVPRPNNYYLMGATLIESESLESITVQSALELLSAAYSVHPGFSEARIIDFSVNCRPAFPSNLPRIVVENRLIRINGLYRHGYLISPALVAMVIQYLDQGTVDPEFQSILEVHDEVDRKR